MSEYYKYILGDFRAYNAKAIVLEKEMSESKYGKDTNKVVAITLIYDDGSDTLSFWVLRGERPRSRKNRAFDRRSDQIRQRERLKYIFDRHWK